MGQTLSSSSPFPTTGQKEQVALPLALASPWKTTVLEIVAEGQQGALVWHVAGGRKLFPFLAGYRATCEAYGQNCSLVVEAGPSGQVVFKVRTSDGEEFSGNSPTAPFARMALALQRLDVINGMEAFGFLSSQVQALLRAAVAPTGELDQPLCMLQGAAGLFPPAAPMPVHAGAQPLRPLPNSNTGHGGSGSGGWGVTDWQQSKMGQLLAAGKQPDQRAAMAGTGAAAGTTTGGPSSAPSLQNWLDIGLPQLGHANPSLLPGSVVEPSPETPHPHGLEIPVLPASDSLVRGMQAFSDGLWPVPTAGHSLPPLAKGSRPSSRNAMDPEAELAAVQLAARPLSRARRRPGSSNSSRGGRGWTAFTAYGLEMRDVVRTEAPWASATEVEKLVGQRWAALSPAEKQKYADMAARVRQMNEVAAGAGGGDAARAQSESLGHGGGGGGGGLKRSRSDATNVTTLAEERPQRAVRPSRQYSADLYETPDWRGVLGLEEEEEEGEPSESEQDFEEEIYSELGLAAPHAPGGGRRPGPPPGAPNLGSRGSLRGTGRRGAGRGSRGQPEVAAGVEDDVLSLLASMCEQAIAVREPEAGLPTASPFSAPRPAAVAVEEDGPAQHAQQQHQQSAAEEEPADAGSEMQAPAAAGSGGTSQMDVEPQGAVAAAAAAAGEGGESLLATAMPAKEAPAQQQQ